MNSRRVLLATLLVTLLVAAPAAAQQTLSARGYVAYGTNVFSSSESFEAITGETSKSGIGGGATVIGLWRGLFADVGLSQQKLTGQRVFIDAGTVYPLGIPVEITMRPVDIAGGWRFLFGRVSPFAGAGVSLISYEETADFAPSGDNVSESKTGPLVLAGADVMVVRWLHAGAEVRYRSVKGVLGDGGVSDIFGEDQLGGYALAVRISVGR